MPEEDQGYFFTMVQLPDAASLQRTTAVVDQVEEILDSTDGVQDILTIGGMNILNGTFSSNVATLITTLTPFEERTTPDLAVMPLIRRLQARLHGNSECGHFFFYSSCDSGAG